MLFHMEYWKTFDINSYLESTPVPPLHNSTSELKGILFANLKALDKLVLVKRDPVVPTFARGEAYEIVFVYCQG